MQLYANGEASGEAVELNEDNSWTYTWEKLAVNEDGTAITYTVDEPTVPDGYTKTVGDVTGDAESGFKVEIKNTYTPNPTTVIFPVTKELIVPEGLEGPAEWSFDITVVAVDGAPEADEMTDKITDSEPTVTFGPFKYTAPGTYTYEVTESGEVKGVTNDEQATKTVTVTVVDDGKGNLKASADSTTDEPLTFINDYNVEPVEYDPPVKKILDADDDLTPPDIEGEFTFTITAVSPTNAPLPEETSITNSSEYEISDGLYEFGAIKYEYPGTYTYTVEESGTVPGVTNDATASKTVTVVVTDNGDGTLSFEADDTVDNPVTFTNTYDVDPTTVSFPVTKDMVVPEGLEGPKEWKYTINVAAEDGAPAAKTMSGEVNQNTLTITFGPFEFDHPDTYTYTVTETGTVAGVTNDEQASTGKTVTVTVVDNQDGTLTATADSTDEEPLTFTNTYNVGETTATFPVKKFMKVPSNLKGPKEWSYTFTATPAEGSPVGETMSGTVTQDSDTVTFGTFKFTTPGSYDYTIKEEGTVAGVTNDAQSEKTVTIKVVDNGNGTLTATPTSTKDNPLEFVNVYDVEPTTAQLKVYKKVYASGSTADKIIKLNSAKAEEEKAEEPAEETPAPENQEETPETTEAPAEATEAPETTEAPAETTAPEVVPEETTPEVTTEEPVPAVTEVPVVEEEANAAEDLVSLLRGMSLFTTVYAEEAEETAEATAEATEEVPAETTAPAVVEEPVETVEEPAPTATPAETLTPVFTEEPVATEAPEATATAEATAAPETTGTPETTAAPEATATAEATAAPTGTPEATATPTAEAEEEKTEEEDPVEGSFEAMLKGLEYVILGTAKNGSTLVGLPVKEGDFEFTLDGEGVHEVVTNSAAGAGEAAEAVFSEIEYTEPGTYTYTITETKAPAWYQKNTQTVTATVTVVDDQEGHLVATVKYSPEERTFENYYVTNDVSVDFEGVKELNGRDLEAGEFTFELYDSEGNLLETAQNDATGKVKFSTITYTKADDLGAETEKTFTYTVKETSGSLGGVTYDTNEATITVTVKDDGEGNLTAEVTPAEAPLFTFTNTYEAEGEITLSGTKVLEGGELTEGQFSFELVDSEGNVVETVSNAADGSFSFTTLTYQKNPDIDETGTYTYKIREKIPEDKKGIAYTDKVYDVTITVTDNKDGTLSVTSKPDAGSFSFTNKVLKVLVNKYNDSNKKLKGATITLYDENGAEIVSWTSDGKEPFDFGPYVEAGKKYMIKETKVPKGYTRFKPVVFTVDPDGTVNISLKVDKEGAYKLVDKTIPKEDTPPDKYIPPVVPLPPTDVNGGNSNTGMMGGMLAASMAGVIAALYQLLKSRKQYN